MDRDETYQEWEAFDHADEAEQEAAWQAAERQSAAEIEWMVSRCARGTCLNEGTERYREIYLCRQHYQDAVARDMEDGV